jgi:hypothetical protein
MQKIKHSRMLPITGLLLGMLVWLANNGNPPTGKSAAPFDGNCNDCHSGGNFNGNLTVTGFPATANPGATYDITVSLANATGSPSKAGLQLVVVDANNANCGDLIETASDLGTEFFATREYVEQRGGKNFSGGSVSWDFQWKAPASVPGNTVKVYYIVNMCNGNGGSGGDKPLWDDLSFAFAGPTPVTATISNTVNPTCAGGNNGSITVEPGGGTPPYTYLWSMGQTTQTASNVVAGTYTVTVTASGGSGSATAVGTLTQPAVLNLSASISGTVTCLSSATATATADGGTPGYTFLWSDGQTTSVATFDQTGVFTVTATDANGCTKATTVNIPGNTTPPVAKAGPNGTITCAVPQISLDGAGSSTGANFTYAWTTVGGNIVSGSNSLAPVVNGCGNYTILVTNTANGCTATSSTTVVCNTTAPSASATGGTITCINASVTLVGSTQTPMATFTWTGPGISPANQFEQNPSVNLPGVYTLTVKDPSNGCTKTASATVVEDTALPTANGSVSGPLTCINSAVQLNMSTNASSPTYTWSGPDGFSSNIANPNVSAPGDYFGVVTNTTNGCVGFDTVTVIQTLATPGASASALGQITCVKDTVQLLGNSPLAPDVTYLWTSQNFSSDLQNPVVDTAGTYTLTVTGILNGCTSSAEVVVVQNTIAPFDSIVPPGNLNCNNESIQLNGTPSSQGPDFEFIWIVKEGGHIVSGDTTLSPVVDSTGKYLLKITNINNGCMSLDSVVVNQSPTVTAAIQTFANVSCNAGNNGSATATGGGGNGVFAYLWSNGDTSATATNLAAGLYFATVTDGENCSASVSVTIIQPDALIPNASATGETDLDANDGAATVDPSGGVPPYAYAWNNGGTTQTIESLSPGIYTVSIADANGCNAVQTVTVNAFGCNLSGSTSFTNANCNGSNDGLASVNLTGAVNPVTYAWSNGATTQSVNNLAPGVYIISVVDGNFCQAVLSVSISEPSVLSANASASDVTFLGASDGTATANPTGGTPVYTYLWSDNGTNQTITGLAPGTYTVTVTDANGCTVTQTATVSAFTCALSATIVPVDVSCFGGSDGQATIAVIGGVLPYSYLWSTGASGQTATNLPVGSFTATATDATGCTVTQSVNVGQPTLLVATVNSVQNVLCPQDKTGSVNIGVSGGTAPYSFNWPGGNSNNFGVGTYTVVITDANNCTASATFSIVSTDIESPVLTCPAGIQICGGNVVSYGPPSVSDNCGVEGPPIRISGPASGSALLEGAYTIVYQATDVSGNSSTCSFSIVVNVVPDILIDDVSNDVNGQGVGTISVTPVGSGGFSFAWNKNGQSFASTEDLSGLNAGSYTLTITDMNGCTSALAPITITNTVGTSEPGKMGSVRLWPNPARSAIQLEIIDLDVIAVAIVDLRGGLVQQIQPSELSSEIDIQQLPAGMYCLKISTATGRVLSLKFVKTGG